MVTRTDCWRTKQGTLHTTWDEAAASETAALMMVILPTWADGISRQDIATEIGRTVFIDKDKAATEAVLDLLAIFKTTPKEATEPYEPDHSLSLPAFLESDEKPGWFKGIVGGKK